MVKVINNEQNDNRTDYQKINKRKRVQIYFNDASLTQQHLKDECDINNIIKKYQVTGELPEPKKGFYADVSALPDYQKALEIIESAKESFNSLPANVRGQFMNDPGTMLNWLSDPQNTERAIELGLVEKPVSQAKPEPKIDEVEKDKK